MRARGITFTVTALLAVVGALPAAAQGATFTVDSSSDKVDVAPGNGVCASATGSCTLRAAAMEANATRTRGTIVIVPPGRFVLTLPPSAGNDGAGGDIDFRGVDVDVRGAGPGFTVVDANGIDRAITFAPGAGGSLAGMTIRGGDAADQEHGGGVLLGLGQNSLADLHVIGNAAAVGGGIAVSGPSSVRRVHVEGNRAREGGGIAIRNFGAVVADSTINGNRGNQGGGIWVARDQDAPPLTLTNLTISGNVATLYGGLSMETDGSASFLTVTQNGSTSDGAVRMTAGRLESSIVADNSGTQCELGASVVTRDLLDSDGTCGDAATADPLLGPLTDNGGPTPTHALLTGSPAVDATELLTTTDQRGADRPFGSRSDLGAFELGATPPPRPAPPTQPAVGPDRETAEPAEPARTRLRILRRVRRGVARVVVSCVGADGQVCRGRVALRTRTDRPIARRARRFRLAAGESVIVRLRLNALGRRLVRGQRLVKVKAVVRPRTGP
jgi:hypothetical protein